MPECHPLRGVAHYREGENLVTFDVIRRGLTVLAAAVVAVVITATLAWADCHGDGDNAGTGTKHVGANNSTQTMTWNLGDRTTYVWSEAGSGMSTDHCLEAQSDWETVAGHYDARAARTCKPGGHREGTYTEAASWSGRDVTGLQKAAGCIYQQYPPDYLNSCDYVAESEDTSMCPFGAAFPWNDKTHAVYLRRENGDIEFNDGGDPSDPDH